MNENYFDDNDFDPLQDGIAGVDYPDYDEHADDYGMSDDDFHGLIDSTEILEDEEDVPF